jgi:hypothetical protein
MDHDLFRRSEAQQALTSSDSGLRTMTREMYLTLAIGLVLSCIACIGTVCWVQWRARRRDASSASTTRRKSEIASPPPHAISSVPQTPFLVPVGQPLLVPTRTNIDDLKMERLRALSATTKRHGSDGALERVGEKMSAEAPRPSVRRQTGWSCTELTDEHDEAIYDEEAGVHRPRRHRTRGVPPPAEATAPTAATPMPPSQRRQPVTDGWTAGDDPIDLRAAAAEKRAARKEADLIRPHETALRRPSQLPPPSVPTDTEVTQRI